MNTDGHGFIGHEKRTERKRNIRTRSQGSPIRFGKRAFKRDASPEERHQSQEALKRFDPGNSLLNYLLALHYFKSCCLPLRHVQLTKTLARRAGPILVLLTNFYNRRNSCCRFMGNGTVRWGEDTNEPARAPPKVPTVPPICVNV